MYYSDELHVGQHIRNRPEWSHNTMGTMDAAVTEIHSHYAVIQYESTGIRDTVPIIDREMAVPEDMKPSKKEKEERKLTHKQAKELPNQSVRDAIRQSGFTMAKLSENLGYEQSWLSNTIARPHSKQKQAELIQMIKAASN